MINRERWLPGGDKYEDLKYDERRAFYERVEAEQEDILAALKTQVSCWTENTMENGDEPLISDFLNEYPEWDHEQLHGFITKERDRIESLILRDRQNMAASS
ncbi:hypothetical protein [Paenibacillus sp. NEAU-GSW1]|uniref:hypothetical protein n=1 Tax=Paenibacillus sp. NEAU-GSW1 TaxID=2682486 RepID=UPI0012E0CED7|nr:hypothetical protein [Paenibacillus sp. NEAU-GSW1]MUT66050.1 hypothetical protein [Paenibacillus sp. NEAU-GSW1]